MARRTTQRKPCCTCTCCGRSARPSRDGGYPLPPAEGARPGRRRPIRTRRRACRRRPRPVGAAADAVRRAEAAARALGYAPRVPRPTPPRAISARVPGRAALAGGTGRGSGRDRPALAPGRTRWWHRALPPARGPLFADRETCVVSARRGTPRSRPTATLLLPLRAQRGGARIPAAGAACSTSSCWRNAGRVDWAGLNRRWPPDRGRGAGLAAACATSTAYSAPLAYAASARPGRTAPRADPAALAARCRPRGRASRVRRAADVSLPWRPLLLLSGPGAVARTLGRMAWPPARWMRLRYGVRGRGAVLRARLRHLARLRALIRHVIFGTIGPCFPGPGRRGAPSPRGRLCGIMAAVRGRLAVYTGSGLPIPGPPGSAAGPV